METRNAHIIINKIMNNGSIAYKSFTGTPLIVTRVGSQYFFVRTLDIFVCVLNPTPCWFKAHSISFIFI